MRRAPTYACQTLLYHPICLVASCAHTRTRTDVGTARRSLASPRGIAHCRRRWPNEQHSVGHAVPSGADKSTPAQLTKAKLGNAAAYVLERHRHAVTGPTRAVDRPYR